MAVTQSTCLNYNKPNQGLMHVGGNVKIKQIITSSIVILNTFILMEDPGKCLGVVWIGQGILCKRCGWSIRGLCSSAVNHTLALCLSRLLLEWLCPVEVTQRFVVCVSHSLSSWLTRQHSVGEGETGRDRVGVKWIIILLVSCSPPLPISHFILSN